MLLPRLMPPPNPWKAKDPGATENKPLKILINYKFSMRNGKK